MRNGGSGNIMVVRVPKNLTKIHLQLIRGEKASDYEELYRWTVSARGEAKALRSSTNRRMVVETYIERLKNKQKI